MHVLYFIDSLSPGGAEQSLAALAPCYLPAGIRLDVAYLHGRPGLQAELAGAGAGLYCLAGPGGRLGWIRRARRLALQQRPDLIHTTLFEADIAGRAAGTLARVPVVSSLVNLEYGPEQLRNPRIPAWKVRGAQWVDAATARLVVRFQAITRHVADVMSRRLRVPLDRIDVVPRGRDPKSLGRRTAYRRQKARAAIGAAPGETIVLAAARQEFQKGLDVLLQAIPLVLEQVPATRLVIAGRDGNQTPELQTLVRRLDLDDAVRFLGVRDDVPDLLCAADAFVVPSRWEGLGSVLLEAMALEAPIVASDLPAIREIVTDGISARLAPPERPEALAGAVVETLRDRAGSRERARAAHRKFLSDYTIDQVADRTFAFYERALAVPRREAAGDRRGGP